MVFIPDYPVNYKEISHWLPEYHHISQFYGITLSCNNQITIVKHWEHTIAMNYRNNEGIFLSIILVQDHLTRIPRDIFLIITKFKPEDN